MKRLALLTLFLTTLAAVGPSLHSQTAQYDLSVKILPDARRVEVTGTVRLPASAARRDEVDFLLWSRMKDLSVQILEPKSAAPLQRLSSDGADGDRKWTLKPSSSIPAGQSVLLRFSYTSDGGPPAPQFKISPEGSYAGGGGELWYPQTAFKNRETGTLRFLAPPGETAISNGVAKSAPEQRARGEYIFVVDEPVKFGFASGRYAVHRRAGAAPYSLYLLRQRSGQQVHAILNGCARVQRFLTGLFGPFPHQEFKFVEVDFSPSIISGLGEFGYILADDSKIDDFDLAYWAHEFGHEWWGNLVKSAPQTAGQMMLTEGVAQFGALLAVEAIEGEAAAEQFRRQGYQGKTQSAAGYFRLARAGTDFPLTTHLPQNQNETMTMHRLANAKGFILLDMLSRRVGRGRLAAILQRFIKRKSGRTASWQELRRAIEADAGQDVGWFFEQWFERTGAPDYRLTWAQDGRRLSGEITQTAPYFRSTLEVEIRGRGRRLLRTVEVASERTRFEWAVPFKAEEVILDPHYKVLRWLPEFRDTTAR